MENCEQEMSELHISEPNEEEERFPSIEEIAEIELKWREEIQACLAPGVRSCDGNSNDKIMREAADENTRCLIHYLHLRWAAEAVALELSRAPCVSRIILFGSVAGPLTKEPSKFRKYRRLGISIWHQCKDVDLAVWVDNFEQLSLLRRVAAKAISVLQKERDIGVPNHQVDIFLFQTGSSEYQGRLCHLANCPKPGKIECAAEGCGKIALLRQHDEFKFDNAALESDWVIELFTRS